MAFFLASLASLMLAWFAYQGVSVTELVDWSAAPTAVKSILTGALIANLVAYLLIFLMLERLDNWMVVIVLFIITLTALLTAERILMTYFWIALVLTGMIAFRFLTRYQEVKTRTTLLLAVAFVFLFISSIANLLTQLAISYYYTGAIAKLVSYVLILGAMISIFTAGESPQAKATYRMRDMS
jgi:hypothetical protein